jgi:hypothetical protein
MRDEKMAKKKKEEKTKMNWEGVKQPVKSGVGFRETPKKLALFGGPMSAPLCPLAVPKICCSPYGSPNFDRCALFASLHHPPGALRLIAHFDISPY